MSSEEIRVTLAGGRETLLPRGSSLHEVLAPLSDPNNGFIAARVNDRLVDLTVPLDGDAVVEGIGADSEPGLEILRHSASHIMAQAVKAIFPEARVAIGPAIEHGFYYDFDVRTSLHQ